MEKLDRLVERIEGETVGTGEGKIEERGEGAVVESRSRMVEGDIRSDCESATEVFHWSYSFFFVFFCALEATVLLPPHGKRKRLRSRACSEEGVAVLQQ